MEDHSDNFAVPGFMTPRSHPNLDAEVTVGDSADVLIASLRKGADTPVFHVRLLKLLPDRKNVVLLDDPIGRTVFRVDTPFASEFYWRYDKDQAATGGWPEGDARLFVDICDNDKRRKIFYIKLAKTYVVPLPPAV